ncbi:MAG TPA: DNA alkylation repair protein [Actinomycetota bacterium]|nr:DNA alkylation repair protein [Actinomycetota bacterium]
MDRTAREALRDLRAAADPSRKPGMARVGIDVERALGVSIPNVRRIAKRFGRDHALALQLWDSGLHEARILATLVAEPSAMTGAEMESWVTGIGSWDVGDFAADLFASSKLARRKIREWSRRPEGFVRRCAFAMIARRAVSAKDAPDGEFIGYLALIHRAAKDERNEVRKGVNWALRQVGKRNTALHGAAIAEGERLLEIESRSARWIARDALRELRTAP